MTRLSPEFVLDGRDYLSPSIVLLVTSVQKAYSTFADSLQQIFCNAFVETSLRWDYEKDAKTGLEILKASKHSKSLNRIHELADEVFK